MNEVEWWERYGPLNEQVWRYDPHLNRVVRREYLTEMRDFLFKPGGRLLDFGCGTGWVSRPLAQQGMAVDGIDSSENQILEAQERTETLNLSNVSYWCADGLASDRRDTYDAVLLHALVHHIPIEKRQAFLRDIADVLVVGGRLYIYDPLQAAANPPAPAWIADRAMAAILRLLRSVAIVADLYETPFKEALREGWTMRSPDEQPGKLEDLLGVLPPQLSVVGLSPWHCWSVGYANHCMQLRSPWRERFERAAALFYWIDRRVSSTSWYPYLRSWPLVSILAEKNA